MAKKPPTEQESRKNLIGWARLYGAEEQLLKVFARYDELLKHCKTQEERSAIQAMGILEIDEVFTGRLSNGGTLTADGKQIK